MPTILMTGSGQGLARFRALRWHEPCQSLGVKLALGQERLGDAVETVPMRPETIERFTLGLGRHRTTFRVQPSRNLCRVGQGSIDHAASTHAPLKFEPQGQFCRPGGIAVRTLAVAVAVAGAGLTEGGAPDEQDAQAGHCIIVGLDCRQRQVDLPAGGRQDGAHRGGLAQEVGLDAQIG